MRLQDRLHVSVFSKTQYWYRHVKMAQISHHMTHVRWCKSSQNWTECASMLTRMHDPGQHADHGNRVINDYQIETGRSGRA